MGDFGSAIRYLYQNFILRDVLSFVTPGAIVVLTALLLFLPESCLGQRVTALFEYSKQIHWLLYIPLFGVFYMVGFAVQCFGEFVSLVSFYRDIQASWCERVKIFTFNWRDPSNPLSMKTKFKELTKFWEATERDEGTRLGRERLVVLKQMCGNGFLATVIAGVLLATNHWSQQASLWLLLALVILLLASLFWGHRVHVLRQDAREQVTISEYQKRRQES